MKALRIILPILLLLITMQGAWYFLGIAKVNLKMWLMFNACAVASMTLLAGIVVFLITKNRIVMYVSILPLFFFGTQGLVVFPWSGMNIIGQISHILMTLNLLLVVHDLIKTRDFAAGTIGLLLSIAIFSIFIAAQQNYTYHHMEDLTKVLGVKL